MNESLQRPDVIIVGAGLAGLTAARLLKRAGVAAPLVLEANERMGGRIRNLPVSGNVHVEGGAAWVGPTQTRILALASELGVATFQTYDEGRKVLILNGKRHVYRNILPARYWLGMADMTQATLRLERMAERINLEAPWESPHAEHYDSVTLEAWLRRNTSTEFARGLFAGLTEVSFGCTPRALSLLHFLVHIHSAGGLQQLTEIRGAALEQRFVGGSGTLIERLAVGMTDCIQLGTPVTQIIQQGEQVLVKSGEQCWRADRVIVAMSPAAAEYIQFTPSLPPQRRMLMHRWASGKGLKVHMVYESPFWRKLGLSGQASGDEAAVSFCFDGTPPEGAPGILTCFTELDFVQPGMSAEERREARRKAVLATLARYFGAQALQAIDYLECDWHEEPWVVGCVPFLAPGVLTECGPALHAPIGRIHWAGAETSAVWEGHMEGAVRSAERVVQEILAADRSLKQRVG